MKFVVAPIAGYNDSPFRILLSELPYDSIFSEMVATKGITYRNKQTFSMLENFNEKKLVVQVFGNDPVDFINTCRVIKDNGLTKEIDINAGCSIKKIVRSEFGVRLMKQPDAIRRIVFSIKDKFPEFNISLKTRLGLTIGDCMLERLLEQIHDIPLSFISIHGRYASQIFSGTADWKKIDEIAKISPFPVYGNGDIYSYRDFSDRKKYMDSLIGVMLGRGVLKNPFLIDEILSQESGDSESKAMVQKKKIIFLTRLIELRKKIYGEYYAIRETRKYYGWILKGFNSASFYRNYFINEEKYDNIIRTINEILNSKINIPGNIQ